MANILVIGAGVMGTTMTIPATDNGHKSTIVGTPLDQDLIKNIKEKSYHPKLDVILTDTIGKNYNEVDQNDFDQSDLIIIGVSSKGINWFIDFINNFNVQRKNFLIITKGLYINDNNKLDILPNRLQKYINQDVDITAVTGPCKAIELANKNITNVCFVNNELDTAIKLSKLFKNNYYLIQTQDDLVGSEVCAALKNIYAIALGYSQVHYSNKEKIFNPESALFSHCLNEINLIISLLGGSSQTVFGLSGLGDLHVTSGTGRNGTLGKYLAKNKKYSEIISNELTGETVEGAELLIELESYLKNYEHINKLPILQNLLESICGDKNLNIPWDDLNI